jgi:hypothetical protein
MKIMTLEMELPKVPRMGRKKRWPERTAIKFAAGTFDRIIAVLETDEDRMTFMREAVERELERRERKPAKRKAKRMVRW